MSRCNVGAIAVKKISCIRRSKSVCCQGCAKGGSVVCPRYIIRIPVEGVIINQAIRQIYLRKGGEIAECGE